MAGYIHLGGAFWKSKTAVVCARQRLSLEPSKTRVFFGQWATDGTHVYYNNTLHRSIDAATFVGLSGLYGKDSCRCYCEAVALKYGGLKTISRADPASFAVLDSGEEWLSHGFGMNLHSGYAKDKSRVFFNGIEVKKADPNTFSSLTNCYGRDEQAVFFQQFRLTDASPLRWRHIGGHYSRDDRNVYFENRIVTGANPEQIRHVEPFDYEIAYDGDQFFSRGDPEPIADYVAFLRQVAESTAKRADAIENGAWQKNTYWRNWPYREPDDKLVMFEGVTCNQRVEDVEKKLGLGQVIMSKEEWENYIGGEYDAGTCHGLMWLHREEVLACAIESGKISCVVRVGVDGSVRPVFG